MAHDFTRGHSDDLFRSGAILLKILRAGDWRSGAFLTFLDALGLERDGIMEAHLADRNDDD